MFNRLAIIGASGHGRVIADVAIKIGYTDIVFFDDHAVGACLGYPIIGASEGLDSLDDGKTDFVIAVGDNAMRRELVERHDVNWVTLIHPSAQIGTDVKIGKGTVVMANAVINSCTTIGKHCIINSGSIVEHDNVLGDYVHISPRAALGGTVTVGERTWIGIGATVANNISVCADCMIGAGAVVIRDIVESGTYVGVPVRKI